MGLNRNLGNLTEVIKESGGKIGIGTSSPSDKLDIFGRVQVRPTNNGLNNSAWYLIGSVTDAANFGVAHGMQVTSEVSNAYAMTFGTQNSYLTGITEKMRITSGGNVLIGTTTDSGYKLDVEGYLAIKSGGFGGGGIVLKSYSTGASRNWGIFNDQLVYGDFLITTSSTQTGSPNTARIYINSSGNVGIGTTSPLAKLHVIGNTRTDGEIYAGFFTNGTAYISAFGGAAYFGNGDSTHGLWVYNNGNYSFTGSNISDIRAKDNIKDLSFNATEKVMALQPKSYYMKSDLSQIRYGLIAQEVNEILPDLIYGDVEGEDYIGLDYNGVIPVLVKAIQELKEEIEILKTNK